MTHRQNLGLLFLLSELCDITQAETIPQQTYYSYQDYMKKLLTDENSRSIVSDIKKHIIPIE